MRSLSVWVDESEKGNMLVVAGVMADWAVVPNIVDSWRGVKAKLGLPRDAEIKWNLPSEHPTRQVLVQKRRKTKELCMKAIDFIADRDDLSCIAIVMLEQRRNLLFWRKLWSKASVRDFYCEGMKYLIQRAAEEVVEAKLLSCVVVCDTPQLGAKTFTSGAIRRGRQAIEDAYKDWYLRGVDVGPGREHHGGSLEDIGFHPSVLIGNATYHDMLQIADVVAGVTREWVDAVRANRSSSWEVNRFKAVSARFRRRHGDPDFFGDGFVLWPRQNELWASLQRSVR
jgi:hypothetical protein